MFRSLSVFLKRRFMQNAEISILISFGLSLPRVGLNLTLLQRMSTCDVEIIVMERLSCVSIVFLVPKCVLFYLYFVLKGLLWLCCNRVQEKVCSCGNRVQVDWLELCGLCVYFVVSGRVVCFSRMLFAIALQIWV